jgi:hypothetical protein
MPTLGQHLRQFLPYEDPEALSGNKRAGPSVYRKSRDIVLLTGHCVLFNVCCFAG